MDTDML